MKYPNREGHLPLSANGYPAGHGRPLEYAKEGRLLPCNGVKLNGQGDLVPDIDKRKQGLVKIHHVSKAGTFDKQHKLSKTCLSEQERQTRQALLMEKGRQLADKAGVIPANERVLTPVNAITKYM